MTVLPANTNNDSITPRQASTDSQLIGLWLHGRPRHTQRAYRFAADAFGAFVHKPLPQVTIGDVQAFADMLATCGLATNSTNRRLSSIKSLLAFGHRIGYLIFDVGRVMRLPPVREGLSQRILSEAEVQQMLNGEPNPRNRTMLLLLYACGLRVSEVCGLCGRDLEARENGGQLTVFGKGGKTRAVLIPASVWEAVQSLPEAKADGPIFPSRRGGALDASQVWRIVRAASIRAGIAKDVSPHFFRHSHASHALDHGAPIHLVQATLGHSSVATTGRYLHARPSESSSTYLPL